MIAGLATGVNLCWGSLLYARTAFGRLLTDRPLLPVLTGTVSPEWLRLGARNRTLTMG